MNSEHILKLCVSTYCWSFIIFLKNWKGSQGGSDRAKHHSDFEVFYCFEVRMVTDTCPEQH